jgi:O-antigen ligase
VVYPRYARLYNGLTVEHAHNDYLELLAENGIVGGLIGLSFIGLLSWRGLASLRLARSSLARAIIAGSLAACSGLTTV